MSSCRTGANGSDFVGATFLIKIKPNVHFRYFSNPDIANDAILGNKKSPGALRFQRTIFALICPGHLRPERLNSLTTDVSINYEITLSRKFYKNEFAQILQISLVCFFILFLPRQ